MQNLFFSQIQQIQNENILAEIIKKNLFFSYFYADQKYYILIFDEQEIDRDFIYKLFTIIQEIDSQKRKLRSFRGFFVYILKLQNDAEKFEFLQTNLKPYFWFDLKNIIRQNNNQRLLEFLFGTPNKSKRLLDRINLLEKKILHLEKQIESLADDA